jgi:hypothetical protein
VNPETGSDGSATPMTVASFTPNIRTSASHALSFLSLTSVPLAAIAGSSPSFMQ